MSDICPACDGPLPGYVIGKDCRHANCADPDGAVLVKDAG